MLVDIWVLFSIFAIANIAAVNSVLSPGAHVSLVQGFSEVHTPNEVELLGDGVYTCSTRQGQPMNVVVPVHASTGLAELVLILSTLKMLPVR